jgi:hypothetical protein
VGFGVSRGALDPRLIVTMERWLPTGVAGGSRPNRIRAATLLAP